MIGINEYKIPGAHLRGCVNDVEQMRDVIQQYCGFSSSNISTLLDSHATTARMKTEIQRLVEGAIPGDVLFLHFSGHGSNVPDKSGDEADQRDEILCPFDLDWADPLLDDFLCEVFGGLDRRVNLTVVFDCCHSGTATRAILAPDSKQPIQRYLPCPLDLMATESGRSLRGLVVGQRAQVKQAAAQPKTNVATVDSSDVLISGCRDDETSADAYIAGSFNGALTYHLVKAIKAGRGMLTYRQLHADTLSRIKADGFYQTPQLSGTAGNIDRPFLQPYAGSEDS